MNLIFSALNILTNFDAEKVEWRKKKSFNIFVVSAALNSAAHNFNSTGNAIFRFTVNSGLLLLNNKIQSIFPTEDEHKG